MSEPAIYPLFLLLCEEEKKGERERKGKQNEKEKKRAGITAHSSSLCRLARFSLSHALNPPPSLFIRLSPPLLFRRAICCRYFTHVFVTPTKYYVAFATFPQRSGISMLERHALIARIIYERMNDFADRGAVLSSREMKTPIVDFATVRTIRDVGVAFLQRKMLRLFEK